MNTIKSTDHSRLSAIVSGKVQGVYFRAFVAEKARRLGLTGYVRNLSGGGQVEIAAQGERGKLEKLVEYLKKGPPAAIVENVSCNWSEPSSAYSGFSILY